jgi:hypothetical protein
MISPLYAFFVSIVMTLAVSSGPVRRAAPADSDGCTECPPAIFYTGGGCPCVLGTGTTWETAGVCREDCWELTPCTISVNLTFHVVTPCILYCVARVRQTPLDPWQSPANLIGSNINPGCGLLQPIGEVGAFQDCDDSVHPNCSFVVAIGCKLCQ